MTPHQQRVTDEKSELAEKRYKLGDFIENNIIFPTLSVEEQLDLKDQHGYMTAYWDCLQRRIARFTSVVKCHGCGKDIVGEDHFKSTEDATANHYHWMCWANFVVTQRTGSPL